MERFTLTMLFILLGIVAHYAPARWVLSVEAPPVPALNHTRRALQDEWDGFELRCKIGGDGFPKYPLTITKSPIQKWFSKADRRGVPVGNDKVWDAQAIAELVRDTPAGEFNVTLQMQKHSSTFLHHVRELGGLAVSSAAQQQRESTTLRAALRKLWPPVRSVGDAVGFLAASAISRLFGGARPHHYLSHRMDDLPKELAEPLFTFLPQGSVRPPLRARFTLASSHPSLGRLRRCMADDRLAAHVNNLAVEGSLRGRLLRLDEPAGCMHGRCADCRGLSARMWLGGAGVSAAAHYDGSHNLFFQARAQHRIAWRRMAVEQRRAA
jgi:hypothetical protein